MLALRTKPGLNCDILPALCRSVIHRRAASLATCSPKAACRVSLFQAVCGAGFHIPTRGWSDLLCFTTLHVKLLILLSKQCFFALPFSSPLFTVHTSFYYAFVLNKSLKNEINCHHDRFIFAIKMDFTGAIRTELLKEY